jgi:hypothetical protein
MSPSEYILKYARRCNLQSQDIDFFLSVVRDAISEEREACAKVAEAYRSENNGMLSYITKEQVNDVTCGSIAAAILDRGK